MLNVTRDQNVEVHILDLEKMAFSVNFSLALILKKYIRDIKLHQMDKSAIAAYVWEKGHRTGK